MRRKILFIRLGKIGDIVVASSVFKAWKEIFPYDELSLVTLPENREVLKYNDDISNFYFSKRNFLIYFLLLKLFFKKFDGIVDLNDDASTTSAMIRKILRYRTSIGFNFGSSKADIGIERPDKNTSHIIERLRILLSLVDKQFGNLIKKPIVYLGEEEEHDIAAQISAVKEHSKIIAVNLSAGAAIRYWQEESWVLLIQKIMQQSPQWKFILLYENKDQEKFDKIIAQLDTARIIQKLYSSFQHYAAYLKNSDYLITADTSAVHIASAFNVPMVVLYPNYVWNFVSWQPLSNNFKAVRSSSNTLSAIDVESVYQSFLEIVKKNNN